MTRPRGLFVTLEGPEGSGKSVQATRLLDRLHRVGVEAVHTREPGGTPVGDALREVLLKRQDLPLAPRAQVLVLCASRAQLVDDVIQPALLGGKVVVCDRYADSTLAYQGYGHELPLDELRTVLRFATAGLVPDLTVLLDLPVDAGLLRKRGQPDEWNRFEAEELAFHERVRSGYHALASEEPQRWVTLDGAESRDMIAVRLWDVLEPRLRTACLLG